MYSRKKFENLVQTQGRTFFFTDSQRANNLRFHYKTLNSRLFVECNFIYFIIEWKKKSHIELIRNILASVEI